ncbi:MAG: ribose 5-phosphate isomerase B [bacterium]
MKIAIASDHAGFPLKQALLRFFTQEKIQFQDLGVDEVKSVDYPDFAALVSEAVSSGKVDSGILVCGTGLGMSIAANKFKGIRAVTVGDVYSARMAKEHNDANVLSLGARTLDPSKAVRLVKAWLKASYKGGRHQNRLDKITEIENKNLK